LNNATSLNAITVDQLVALNDEIRALARAGVPLERGLRALGGDLPGRLGRLAESLAQRLERGESLVHVIESSADGFPAAYRAVLAAGIRSGRLPAALESVSRSVRQAAELRRTMIASMVYPFCLVTIASAVFVLTMWRVVPVTGEVFALMDVAPPAWHKWLTAFSGWLLDGLPWIWVLILCCAAAWWFRSRSAVRWGSTGGWIPTIGAVRRAGRMATFTELLAMLVEQQIPLADAVALAAAAGGGREIRRAGELISGVLRHGSATVPATPGIPPLLTWLILTSARQPFLARSLRQSAEMYRRRAIRWSTLLGTYLPIFLSALVGGTIVLYYVLMTMAPFYYLLHRLGQP
jgi:general secretion pathway protein F